MTAFAPIGILLQMSHPAQTGYHPLTRLLACALLAICFGPLPGAQAADVQEVQDPPAAGQPAGPPDPPIETNEETQEAGDSEPKQDAAVAVEALEEPGAAELTLASLQTHRESLQASTSLSETARTAALAEIQLASEALTRTDAAISTTAQYRADILAAPDRITEIQASLAIPLERTLPERRPGSPLSEVQDQRDAAAAALAEAQGARDRFQATSTRRSERRVAIDGELLAAQVELDGLLSSLEAPAVTEQDPAILDAQRQRLLAEIQETRALLGRLDAEQDRNQAEEQLTSLRLDLARRHARAMEEVQEAWDQILREGRSQEAEEAVRRASQARTDLALKHADLAEVIASIDQLSAELTGSDSVVAKMNTASEERTRLDKELLRVRASYADTIYRFRVAGATQALGFFLRLEYAKLDDPHLLRVESRRRQRDASEALYRVLVLAEHRGEFGDVGERVQELVKRSEGEDSFKADEDKQAFAQAATELFTNERELAESLRRNNEDYAEILTRTETTVSQLITLTELYERFIRQHIIWQRSVDRPFHLELPNVLGGLHWALTGDTGDVEALWKELSRRKALVVLFGLLVAALFSVRRKMRARIAEIAPLVSSYRTDSLGYTRKVLVYTVVAAMAVPLTVYGASWLLDQTGGGPNWRASWANVLSILAGYAVPLCLILEVLRQNGLARAHLRWPEEPCRKLGLLIIEFLLPMWVLGLVQLPFQVYGDSPYRDTTGRLIFIISMAVLSVFCFRLLSPRGPILHPYYVRHRDSLLNKTRGGVHAAVMALSASIVVLAVFGYFFTARMMARGLLGTLILAFAVALLVGLANRWQVFHRRRLALAKAVERRAEREAGGAEPEATEATEFNDDIDISSLDAKTRTLISNCAAVILVVGLLSIWSEALPALRVLERVQILPTLQVSPEQITASEWMVPGLTPVPAPTAGTPLAALTQPDGASPEETAAAPTGSPTPSPFPGMGAMAAPDSGTEVTTSTYRLTAADILAALVILLVTILVVRNGPALLELGVLTRINIDAGARYAITTLVRYALITIGVTLAFNALGVGWQSVQWLAAAMTFGLAFGLQEIFANFISGLILLVERPIRIGDTVTIGDLTGTVGRIRPRATTILDFDNRERLIPNKMLITDEVINWTLSSAVTRQVARVGVAYGTDTGLVFRNLMRAGTESAFTMKDPAPSVLFKGFGESTLDFDLRFYLPDRDNWLDAMNDVNVRIDKLFREAGIEIAFPQRDLHVRSSDVPLTRE